jgi:hypothetical protein
MGVNGHVCEVRTSCSAGKVLEEKTFLSTRLQGMVALMTRIYGGGGDRGAEADCMYAFMCPGVRARRAHLWARGAQPRTCRLVIHDG